MKMKKKKIEVAWVEFNEITKQNALALHIFCAKLQKHPSVPI